MNEQEQKLYNDIKEATLGAERYVRNTNNSSPVLKAILRGIMQTALGRDCFAVLEKERREAQRKLQAGALYEVALKQAKTINLQEAKSVDLKEIARALAIPGAARMKKDELISNIKDFVTTLEKLS